MALDVQGVVGPQTLADGSKALPRLGKSGEVIAGIYGGKYSEWAYRGMLYHAATAATGVAPGTALSTTAAFALANPAGSGVNLYVCSFGVGYISGTLGAGHICCAVSRTLTDAAASGTAITPLNALIGGAAGKGLAFTTATLATTPVEAFPVWTLSAALASTAVQAFTDGFYDVDGKVILMPGTELALEGIAAAGTSPLVVLSCSWAELPL